MPFMMPSCSPTARSTTCAAPAAASRSSRSMACSCCRVNMISITIPKKIRGSSPATTQVRRRSKTRGNRFVLAVVTEPPLCTCAGIAPHALSWFWDPAVCQVGSDGGEKGSRHRNLDHLHALTTGLGSINSQDAQDTSIAPIRLGPNLCLPEQGLPRHRIGAGGHGLGGWNLHPAPDVHRRRLLRGFRLPDRVTSIEPDAGARRGRGLPRRSPSRSG